MPDSSAATEFKQGIRLLQEGHTNEAYEYFRSVSELQQQNPYYMSFLGVSMGRAKNKWNTAVELCETALKLKRNEPQLYLNLAEVYRHAGYRDDAIALLEQASMFFKGDPRFKKERANLGMRREPAFSLLERGHILNRFFGKLQHQIFGPVRQIDGR